MYEFKGKNIRLYEFTYNKVGLTINSTVKKGLRKKLRVNIIFEKNELQILPILKTKSILFNITNKTKK